MRPTWILKGHIAASGMIGPSDVATLEQMGLTAVVSLTLRSPFPDGPPGELTHLHLPVPDMCCPPHDDLLRAVEFLQSAHRRGSRTLVHCGAGYGRTGTVIACYLVARGTSLDAAMQKVRAARPGSIETREQERGIAEYARLLRGSDHG